MAEIKKIKDKRPKVIILDYNGGYEDHMVIRYPKLPPFVDIEVDTETNPEKDVTILAHAISTLIAYHEQNGGNGAKLLKSAVTQMEAVFIDPDVSVSKKTVSSLDG